MNRFLTLLRRDVADSRGALVLTPVILALVILGFGLLSSLTGPISMGYDMSQFREGKGSIQIGPGDEAISVTRENGQVMVDDGSGPKPLGEIVPPETRGQVSAAIPLASGLGAVIPLGIAAIVIVFVLTSSLYEERRDRSILFWKSMPVTDHATVASKFVAAAGVGFAMALLAAFGLHLGMMLLGFASAWSVGLLSGIPASAFVTMVSMWPAMILMVVTYVAWASPVYGWFLLASAFAPKAPFLVAIVPMLALPLAGLAVRNTEEVWRIPMNRLIGRPMWESLDFSSYRHDSIAAFDLPATLASFGHSWTQPGLWIGLAVAAALMFAAAEVRRRRAF